MANQTPSLRAVFVKQSLQGELEALRVEHPRFKATVLLQGAQLIEFAPAGDPNWLWLSPAEPFVAGKAVRGGIPLCWPWFGDPGRNPTDVRASIRSSSAHGLARLATWRLERLRETVHEVVLTLVPERWPEADEPLVKALSPQLTIHMSGHALRLELLTENTGSDTLHYTEALHTYLPTQSVADSRVQGLHDRHYLDTLRDWRVYRQQGALVFQGETDRIYTTDAPIELVTPETHVRVESHGSHSAVLWNPGPHKAQRLSHFRPDDWRHMLCIETANAADDAVRLEPGKHHRLGLHLTCRYRQR